MVPTRVLDLVASGQLDPIDVAVVAALLGFARSRPWTDSTANQLATRIRRSEGTVRRSLGRLESAGLIVREGQVKLLTWRGQRGLPNTPTPGAGDGPASRRRSAPLAPVITSPLAPALATVEGSQSRDGVDRNDDVSTSTLPEPIPTVDQILALTIGADQGAVDRAAHRVIADLGDDPGRLDQHRRNLAKVARGDCGELARVLVGLLTGRRARLRGGKGGLAFASAYLAFATPDAAQADLVVNQTVADLRSHDQAAAVAEAAVAARAHQQAQERAERHQADERRAGLRKALAGVRLPADASPAAIVAALAAVGLTLTAQRLPGLRPRLSLGDELGLGDLPPGFREALERGREALASHLEQKPD